MIAILSALFTSLGRAIGWTFALKRYCFSLKELLLCDFLLLLATTLNFMIPIAFTPAIGIPFLLYQNKLQSKYNTNDWKKYAISLSAVTVFTFLLSLPFKQVG
ncbi:hypothetical protein [Candidatus Uabimicrobium sp. HlEnr_7]|uniref:hypothetical protein n=1 Tax=Candidatus Uabimicrobium helgolandensis TaxID=3095367 RepID=UPI0035571950